MEETVIRSFRTAVGGFHKGDVMNYISQTAEKHEEALKERDRYITELTAENQSLRDQLAALNADLAQLKAAAEAAEKPEAPAESEAAEKPAEAPAAQEMPSLNEQELAAYRRAERAERTANARAKKQYQALADFTAEVEQVYDASGEQVRRVLDTLSQQIAVLKAVQAKLSETSESCRTQAARLPDPDTDND